MRTTLNIDEDVLRAAKELARREKKTAGAVISELTRRALTTPPAARAREPKALHDADELEPSPLTRREPVGATCQRPDAVGSRLVQVALRDICRVEVNHPRARISDW